MRYIVFISEQLLYMSLYKIENGVLYCYFLGDNWVVVPEGPWSRPLWESPKFTFIAATEKEVSEIWMPKLIPHLEELEREHEAIMEEINNMTDEELQALNKEMEEFID